MLCRLTIRDFVLVDRLELSVSQGIPGIAQEKIRKTIAELRHLEHQVEHRIVVPQRVA